MNDMKNDFKMIQCNISIVILNKLLYFFSTIPPLIFPNFIFPHMFNRENRIVH